MQVRADQLATALTRGGLKTIYTIHGDEPLLAQEAADALRAAARAAGFSERQVFTVSGAHFDWSGVLGAAQSMGLFADKKIIEIRIPSGKPGKDGSAALQAYCEQLSEEVLTIVHLPRLDRQQQQGAWFLALDRVGVTVRVDPVERHALPNWIAQRLAKQGQRVAGGEAGQQALAFFADRVEGNLLAAHQELQKLALLHPEGELSFEQIEAAVLDVARFDVFQLGATVLAGQVPRALRMLDGLKAEGEAAVLVHWTLTEDIRSLQRARSAMASGKPVPMALREARVWGDKERAFEALLPAIDDERLAALVEAASTCDGLIKGLRHAGWPDDAWDGLRRLMLMTLDLVAAARSRRGQRPSPLALQSEPSGA
ncbi:MAG TPA: DNA polymerase III subunit delta [Ideonella sp.]|uniref:DNA polymerase III subunit delta n=1 Tax=Ideonella sp. TaxID=1929293 RepID=UPI002E35FC74|nr:DNA polymerase III subunit delta [Ideonella sp.]HEX5686036.1 DNA polymerase III subunit delta [Ideonella sp.]